MKKKIGIQLFLLISGIALLINVGSYGLVESSDARYAEIARKMVVSGDYLHPDLLDVHHYHKPPLTYQITAIGYKLFGFNAFGARFFLQIAVLLQLILIYALTLLLFNKKQTALWATIIYFSFPIVLISSRNLTTDAFLTTFILLGIYAWVKYRKSGIKGYLYLFAFSLALGFLTKGPVVFIVPLTFVLAYNYIEKPKNKTGVQHFLACLLFLVIAFSWFVYLGAQNPDFIDYFLGRQTADRFSKNVFNRAEPFWYFLALAPLLGLPWLLIFFYLLKENKNLFSRKSIYVAMLLGVIIPLIFFSISSSKRILYILPFYGLLAISIAQLATKISGEKAKVIGRIILGYTLLIISAFIATLFIKSELYFPKVLGLVSIFLTPFILWLYNTPKIELKSKPIYLTVVISVFLLISSSHLMSCNQLKINSPKPVTDFIIEEQLGDRDILVFNTRKPAIAFGLNKSIISLYNGNSSLTRETQFEPSSNWKNYLINMNNTAEIQTLKQILEKPSVLIVYKHPLPENMQWLTNYYENKKEMDSWSIYY